MINNINKFQVKCPYPVTAMVGFPNDTNERTWPGSVIMKKYQEGELFGKCIYLREAKRINKYKRRAFFKCVCGCEFEAQLDNVKSGHTKSCGCFNIICLKERSTHGLSNHPLFRKWNSIKNRCFNKSAPRYKDWGGRGIRVCDEWVNDFKSFYDYVIELPNYNKAGMTLDRYPDNDGNYEPGNLRWATTKQQNTNKRRYGTI